MGKSGGFVGAFIAGTFAGVIASPCVGPVLVGILAYIAKTQNSALGFALLFTFALGFGTLFIVLGTFSQLSSKLPRSGTWMVRIKSILGAILIILSFYYAWPLIKRGLPTSHNNSTQTKKGVVWTAYSPKAVDDAKASGTPVIIDFFANWCLACVEMDQLTFSQKPIVEKAKNFVMLKVDATNNFPELRDLQEKYKVMGLPTMIFIDKKGQEIEEETLTGFEAADLFIQRMDRALEQ